MGDSVLARKPYLLPVIIVSQFACASLWFAGNAVLPQLQQELSFEGGVALVTSSVQLGFIVGTAFYALSGFADRFEARSIFFVSSLVGSAANVAILSQSGLWGVVLLRFVTGVALAGIYPIGIKAAAGWYKEGLGRALGLLVGALVVGTALPHLIGTALPWRYTLVSVSLCAACGGIAFFMLVKEGPFVRRSTFSPKAIPKLMANTRFRGAALGYFGHMWELYAFWAFLPALIKLQGDFPVALTSFGVIAFGLVGCIGGALLVNRFGSLKVAACQLGFSGLCCLALPWLFYLPAPLFLLYLALWGAAVVGDSPQFSAINAEAAPPTLVGTGLTFVTAGGFGLTILSIDLVEAFSDLRIGLASLALGPALGLIGLRAAGAKK